MTALVFPLLVALAGAGDSAPGGAGAEWSYWRGPGARGISTARDLPERWSAAENKRENIAWTVDLPGWGNSSPVLSADRVYVTSQTDDKGLHLLAIDRSRGAIVWDQKLGSGKLKAHELHNMATPTPAVDGDRVWALFGTGDLFCVDRDGKAIWQRDLQKDEGKYKILWGMGSSPILHGDHLFLACIHPGPSYVAAFDKATGAKAWSTLRNLPCVGEATDSYSSPALLEAGGRVELIVAGADHIDAYDPASGKQLWVSSGLKIEHAYGRTISSPGVGDGFVVACSASVQGLGKAVAVRSGGAGDVTASHRLWQYDKFTPDCPTPLCHGGEVYLVKDDGIASCLDAKTGKLHWKKRLVERDFKASPVYGDGKVYFLSMDGDCVVLKAGPEYKELAVNKLEGSFIATPAFADGRIYFRAKSRIYAVGAR